MSEEKKKEKKGNPLWRILTIDISQGKVMRVLRWVVVLLTQLTVLCIICLRIGSSLTIKAEPYVDWFFDYAFIFSLPVGFLMTLNVIALMVDGCRYAKWPCWKVLWTYFAMGIPVYAVVYYWCSEKEILKFKLKPDEAHDE